MGYSKEREPLRNMVIYGTQDFLPDLVQLLREVLNSAVQHVIFLAD